MDRDGDGRRGPRTSVVLIATLIAVAAAVGATLAVSRWFKPADEATVVETTTTVDENIDVELLGAGSLNKIIDRTTEAGIQIRVHVTDDPNVFGFAPQADDVPDWCVAEKVAMVTAVSADAVAQNQIPLTKAIGPDLGGAQFWGGQFEGAPIVGLLMQVDDDVRAVKAVVPGGGFDQAEPVESVVALAMSAPPPKAGDNPVMGFEGMAPAAMSVDVLRSDGSTQRLDPEDYTMGPLMWRDQRCFGEQLPENQEPFVPEPPKLPPAGGPQPADPEAAISEVHAAMTTLYRAGRSADAARVALLDDPSGVQYALDNVRKFDPNERIDKIKLTFGDYVFLTDTEVSFLYTSEVDRDVGEVWFWQFGRARLLDGVWKITRATYCQDIAHIGWNCGP